MEMNRGAKTCSTEQKRKEREEGINSGCNNTRGQIVFVNESSNCVHLCLYICICVYVCMCNTWLIALLGIVLCVCVESQLALFYHNLRQNVLQISNQSNMPVLVGLYILTINTYIHPYIRVRLYNPTFFPFPYDRMMLIEWMDGWMDEQP